MNSLFSVFELWFKQIIFEIDSIRNIFIDNDDVTPLVFNINLRLNRTGKIWNLLIDQLQVLESMTPMEFLRFREYITPASGFQSLQFRIIEMKLGLTDQSRKSYRTKYFLQTMFKDKQSEELQTSVGEVSLLRLIEVCHQIVIPLNHLLLFSDGWKNSMIEHHSTLTQCINKLWDL
jgi:tryptophan 2,3-dioxygenase